MFKKIAAIQPTADSELLIWFVDGEARLFRADACVRLREDFAPLADGALFRTATLAAEGYGVSWGDAIDLSCKEVYDLSTSIDIVDAECRRVISEVVATRHDKGLSQARLAAAAGVKQPVIARLETGINSPRLDTLLKVLTPLGKTLRITDLGSMQG